MAVWNLLFDLILFSTARKHIHIYKLTRRPFRQTDIDTITIYFINPSGKLKLSFDRTTKNIIILNHEPYAHTHS